MLFPPIKRTGHIQIDILSISACNKYLFIRLKSITKNIQVIIFLTLGWHIDLIDKAGGKWAIRREISVKTDYVSSPGI